MSSEGFEDEDLYDPQRDERGRYVKGSSGNLLGRGAKRPQKPKSLEQILAAALRREVAVNDNGTSRMLPYRELFAETLLRAALRAKPKDLWHVWNELEQRAAQAEDDEEPEEIFTEEDRRLIESVKRALGASDQLQVSRAKDASVGPTRQDFTFE